ncbi:uncharacterized protein LOC122506559 isoform X1 [Leptopilina heterotoma]|uniref:uncharacterized protein LOC122506559 isoform X1 n=1 Tax=Leptopilina heterotoma TaxID=63436 RepID=UPI001CA89859|nr:uncharacterized protein LOC122506559 isoform X1 [Leptopilina heterotoma]
MNFKVFLLFGLVLFVCTENVKSLPVPDGEEAKPAEVAAEVAAEPKKADEDDDADEDISLSDLAEIKEFFEELEKGFDEILKALKEVQEETLSKEKEASTPPKTDRK